MQQKTGVRHSIASGHHRDRGFEELRSRREALGPRRREGLGAAVEDPVLHGGRRASDRIRRDAGAKIDPTQRVAQRSACLSVRFDVGVKDDVLVGVADDLDSVRGV